MMSRYFEIKIIRPRKRVPFRVLPKDERRATVPTPETWNCVVCGVDTAPGYPGRAKMMRNFKRYGFSKSIVDLRSEIYTVHNAVWKRARMKPDGGCLCIGCLEKRLGRRLRPTDFVFYHVFNEMPGTWRLLQRRGELSAWRHLWAKK